MEANIIDFETFSFSNMCTALAMSYNFDIVFITIKFKIF